MSAAPSAGPPPGGGAAPARRPALEQAVRERWARDWLRNADVIYAVDAATGEWCGLFYGDPAVESLPLDADNPFHWPAIVEFPVDREADDLDVLAEMVELIKGSCSFVSDIRKLFREPAVVEDLRRADLIYAVDGATGERCGLFYGDPATEGRPVDGRGPGPAVLEVAVNALGDDREALANAVFRVKGVRQYATDIRKVLRDPETLEDLTNADLIFAIDRATEERCGVFYGHPATESLPIYHLEPWRPRPSVLEVYVDPAGDDRDVLAAAVREVKGSCTYRGG